MRRRQAARSPRRYPGAGGRVGGRAGGTRRFSIGFDSGPWGGRGTGVMSSGPVTGTAGTPGPAPDRAGIGIIPRLRRGRDPPGRATSSGSSRTPPERRGGPGTRGYKGWYYPPSQRKDRTGGPAGLAAAASRHSNNRWYCGHGMAPPRAPRNTANAASSTRSPGSAASIARRRAISAAPGRVVSARLSQVSHMAQRVYSRMCIPAPQRSIR